MLKKTVTYTDYNGVEKKETNWFHLNESDLAKMQLSEYGTMDDRLQAMVDRKDISKIMDQFEDLLRLSYGVKTPDGRFIKKENGVPLFGTFQTTAAYDAIFMELITNPDFAAEFATGILPEKYQKEAKKAVVEAMDKGDNVVALPAT